MISNFGGDCTDAPPRPPAPVTRALAQKPVHTLLFMYSRLGHPEFVSFADSRAFLAFAENMWSQLCEGVTTPNEALPTHESFVDALTNVLSWEEVRGNGTQTVDQLLHLMFHHLVSIIDAPQVPDEDTGSSMTSVYVNDNGDAGLTKVGVYCCEVVDGIGTDGNPYLFTLCQVLAAVVGYAVKSLPFTGSRDVVVTPRRIVTVHYEF